MLHLPGAIILHSHLEGSVPTSSLRKIATRNGVELPAYFVPQELSKRVRLRGWPAFFEIYTIIVSCFRSSNDFRDAVRDYAIELSQSDVAYIEVYCTPWLHISRGISFDDLARGLESGVMWARANVNTDVRILVDLIRHPDEPADEIVEWFLGLTGDVFVGLGLTGGPNSIPLLSYRGISQRIHAANRGFVVHAGELQGPESVYEAIYTLGAKRIGHGLRILEDPVLADAVVSEDVHFELCPISNIHLVPHLDVPRMIEEFLRKGFSFSLNPDDELIFNTSMSSEIQWVMHNTRLGLSDLQKTLQDAAKHAFAKRR